MRLGRAFLATAVVAGSMAMGTGVAEAAGPPPAFHPYDAYDVSSWPESVAIGDLTGDGRADVLMSTSYYFDPVADYHLWLFAQRADGTLAAPVSIATGAAYGDDMSIELADLDGDADLDVALATTNGIEVYTQAGGGIAYSRTLAAAGASQVEAGDLTGDGRADLVARTSSGIQGFAQVDGDLVPLGTITATGTSDIELADVTGDGLADVVGLTGATVTVFRNTPTGAWPSVAYPTGGTAPWASGNGVAAGDLTGDGRIDVGVTMGGNTPNGKVAVLAQQADGTLAPAVVQASYDIPETAEAADANGDGRTDLVVLHGGWNRVGIYLQQDDGRLGGENLYPIPYASHYNVDGLAMGDITGDGLVDVAIADYNQGLVVLRSAGPGADVTPPDTTVTGGPSGTWRSRSASFTFTASEPGATFECRLDSAAYAPCSSPASLTGLAAGTHTFWVRALDAAKNVDPSPASRTFTVDGPDTTITAGPTGTVRSTSATFSFTGTPTPSGFECSLDSAAFTPCSSPTTYTGLAPSSLHSLRVRAVNAEGLADSTPATRQWTVDAAADLSVTLTDAPDPVKRNSTLTYTLRVTNTGPSAAAGVATTQGLPSGITLSSVSTTVGTCTSSGNPATVRCSVGTLAPGATATITVVTKVTAGNNTVLTSTAVATGTSWDPDASDDSAATSTKVGGK
jgi:uncharacterized repeat protein (TIGR01451 family)